MCAYIDIDTYIIDSCYRHNVVEHASIYTSVAMS